MAPEVREVQEGLEDREVQEVQEDPVAQPQKNRDHQEVLGAREDLLQNHHPVNRVAREDLEDQGVLEALEDQVDLGDQEVQLQKDQNQE